LVATRGPWEGATPRKEFRKSKTRPITLPRGGRGGLFGGAGSGKTKRGDQKLKKHEQRLEAPSRKEDSDGGGTGQFLLKW